MKIFEIIGAIVLFSLFAFGCNSTWKSKGRTIETEDQYAYLVTTGKDTISVTSHPSRGCIEQKLTGVYYLFKMNDCLWLKADIINGCYNGTVVNYRSDGGIFSEREFVNSQLHGYCIVYKEDGTIKSKRLYKQGQIVEE